MPSKARRAASRQARLSGKKRRSSKGHQEFDMGPDESLDSFDTDVQDSDLELSDQSSVDEGVVAQSGSTATATRARPRTRTPRRTRQQRAAAATTAQVYQYLGGELRIIGIITVIIVALLVALTFVLR